MTQSTLQWGNDTFELSFLDVIRAGRIDGVVTPQKKYLNESICHMFAVSFQRQDPSRIPVKIEASSLESNESRKTQSCYTSKSERECFMSVAEVFWKT